MSDFRKLVKFDEWSLLNIHVALDNAIIISDISTLLFNFNIILHYKSKYFGAIYSIYRFLQFSLHFLENLCQSEGNSKTSLDYHWKPLLLIVPLRLGLNEINPIYISGVQVINLILYSLIFVGKKLHFL